jgi:hypothetical protein
VTLEWDTRLSAIKAKPANAIGMTSFNWAFAAATKTFHFGSCSENTPERVELNACENKMNYLHGTTGIQRVTLRSKYFMDE